MSGLLRSMASTYLRRRAALASVAVASTALAWSLSFAIQSDAAQAIVVEEVSPNAGPLGGGEKIVMKGGQFNDVRAVMFGAAKAAFAIDSPEELTAVAPPGRLGTVDARVLSKNGDSPIREEDRFTYETNE